MLLTFICGWSASDRTRVAGAAASRDVRVILTAVTRTMNPTFRSPQASPSRP